MIIPAVHIPINNTSNFGFTAFFSMIKDGRLNVVTAIINDKIVPSSAPFDNKASATGIVPNISAYIGIPTSVAKITPKGFRLPKTLSIQLSGIQLWITAPIPTPIRMYGNTFLKVPITCFLAYCTLSFLVNVGELISTLVLCQEKVQIKYNQFSLFM